MTTKFEKMVIGVAERLISSRDCPHQSTYPTSVPCGRCNDDIERKATEELAALVRDEGDRRYLKQLRRLGLYPKKKESA